MKRRSESGNLPPPLLFQIGFAFAVRQGGGITQTVCIGGESEAGFGI